MTYLQNEDTGEKTSFLRKVDSTGKFRFVLTLPDTAGKYVFVLASGNSFETTKPETLVLIDESTLDYPEIQKETTTIRPILEEGETPFLRLPDNFWGEIYFRQ